MTNRLNKELQSSPDTGKKLKRFWPTIKYFGFVIGLVIVVAVVYQLVFMVRLTAGISKEKPAPDHIVTIEIVNASGIPQISKNVTAKLSETQNKEILVNVVNAERLDYKELDNSLVISRTEDIELAKYAAQLVGIDKSKVVYRPAIENDMSPMVTIVLGKDIQQLLDPQTENKEN